MSKKNSEGKESVADSGAFIEITLEFAKILAKTADDSFVKGYEYCKSGGKLPKGYPKASFSAELKK
jgi:hypothetical protein